MAVFGGAHHMHLGLPRNMGTCGKQRPWCEAGWYSGQQWLLWNRSTSQTLALWPVMKGVTLMVSEMLSWSLSHCFARSWLSCRWLTSVLIALMKNPGLLAWSILSTPLSKSDHMFHVLSQIGFLIFNTWTDWEFFQNFKFPFSSH